MKMLACTQLIAAMLAIGASPYDDERFDRAVAAIRLGGAVSANRSQVRAAATELLETGARPVGGEDLAATWLRRANAAPPSALRDRLLGPAYSTFRLSPGQTIRFKQIFLAGEVARVAVVDRNASMFRLRISSDAGSPVCKTGSGPDRCYWVPSYTARYTIDVDNAGTRQGDYVIVMQ